MHLIKLVSLTSQTYFLHLCLQYRNLIRSIQTIFHTKLQPTSTKYYIEDSSLVIGIVHVIQYSGQYFGNNEKKKKQR